MLEAEDGEESRGILSFGHEMAIALRIHCSYGYLDKTYTGPSKAAFQPTELIRLYGFVRAGLRKFWGVQKGLI